MRRQHNGFPKGQEAEIRQGALKMIEYEELVYQEAERRKITVPAAQVNKALAEYRGRFPGDEEFEEYLKAEMGGSEDTAAAAGPEIAADRQNAEA
jgi:peptidyl-prolyl cis-trans isomerase SurA